jgi:hypothetical protein
VQRAERQQRAEQTGEQHDDVPGRHPARKRTPTQDSRAADELQTAAFPVLAAAGRI